MFTGGDRISVTKKFIEDEIEFKGDSLFSVIQSAVSMILLSPYKMFYTISTKIVYLKKIQIVKVFLVSFIIACLMTVMKVIFLILTKQFTLFRGTFPLIIEVAGSIVLGTLYLLFGSVQLMAFSSISKQNSNQGDEPEISEPAEIVDSADFGEKSAGSTEPANSAQVSEVPRTFSWFWSELPINLGTKSEIADEPLIDAKVLEAVSVDEDSDNFDYSNFRAPDGFPKIG